MLAKTGGPSVCPSAPGSPSPPAAVTVTVHPERGQLAPGSSERLRAQVIMRTATPDKQHQANQANHHHHHHLRHLPARLLIGDWVNKLEKINANLDDEATSVAARASVAAPAGTGSNLNDAKADDDLDEGELCFKAAQLLTEFCLMLFAARLLTIAVIVIFSKKIPLFMESYEIVPKFLCFLCLFVASYSLCRWLVIKMRDFISKRSASSSPGAITKALPTPPPAPSDDGRLASATEAPKHTTTASSQQIRLATKRCQQVQFSSHDRYRAPTSWMPA